MPKAPHTDLDQQLVRLSNGAGWHRLWYGDLRALYDPDRNGTVEDDRELAFRDDILSPWLVELELVPVEYVKQAPLLAPVRGRFWAISKPFSTMRVLVYRSAKNVALSSGGRWNSTLQ